MAVTNPKGYNQHKPDPRQSLFLQYYLDPKSKTFSNALQSALKAGYGQEYAENITHLLPTWLSEAIGDSYLVKLSEQQLKTILELSMVDSKGRVDNQLMANKLKAINLILKGLAKQKYSERQELSGPDGEEIKIIIEDYGNKHRSSTKAKTGNQEE